MKYVTNSVSNNYWIATRIKVSCKCKTFLYFMSKTTNCSKIEVHYIQYCSVLQKVIQKAKEVYYNELLSSSTNKSKMSWNILIMKLVLCPVRSLLRQNLTLVKNTSTNQPAKIFNNYFINSVDKLITQQPKTGSPMFSLRESLVYEFLQIINIPVTETEGICIISSLKNKTLCGYNGLSNKILKLCGSQISKPITYIYNKSLTCGICPNHLKYNPIF